MPDIIQQAMRMKRKVSFKYFHYNAAKEKVLNHAGEPFSVTPVRVVYADEFYYLIAFMDRWANVEGHQPFSPFRVDRMLDVRVSDELATKDARIATYRSDEHISPSFGVFAAEMTNIVLEFDERVMNRVIDKFGLDALVFKQRGCVDAGACQSTAVAAAVFRLAAAVDALGEDRVRLRMPSKSIRNG